MLLAPKAGKQQSRGSLDDTRRSWKQLSAPFPSFLSPFPELCVLSSAQAVSVFHPLPHLWENTLTFWLITGKKTQNKTHPIARDSNTNFSSALISISVGMKSHFLQALYCLQPSPEWPTCWPSRWMHPWMRAPARGDFPAACESSPFVLGFPSGSGISYGTFWPSSWTRWCPADAGEQIETPCLFIYGKRRKMFNVRIGSTYNTVA